MKHILHKQHWQPWRSSNSQYYNFFTRKTILFLLLGVTCETQSSKQVHLSFYKKQCTPNYIYRCKIISLHLVCGYKRFRANILIFSVLSFLPPLCSFFTSPCWWYTLEITKCFQFIKKLDRMRKTFLMKKFKATE